jgi:hypothetical protein
MECGSPLTQGETKSKLENDSLVIAPRTFLDDSWLGVATVNRADDALEQDPLRELLSRPTTVFGHLHSYHR